MNNIEIQNQNQNTESKGAIFKKAILIVFFYALLCSIFLALFFEYLRLSPEGLTSSSAFDLLSSGNNYSTIIFGEIFGLSLIGVVIIIPMLIGLIIGFYLGIRKGGKEVFIYPIIAFFISWIINLPLLWLASGSCDSSGCHKGSSYMAWAAFFFSITFVLLVSKFIQLKKEKLLFKIFVIFILVLVLFSLGVGEYLSITLPRESQKKRESLEKQLTLLKEEAIKNQNPILCDEIYNEIQKASEEQSKGFTKEIINSLIAKDNYYTPCIETLAISLKDENLCKKIGDIEFGNPPARICWETVRALNKGDINGCSRDCHCISYFAIKDDNPDLCTPCNYYERTDCLREFALGKNDVTLCEKILLNKNLNNVVGSYNRCITDFAFKEKNSDLCKKIENKSENYFTIDKCIEVVRHGYLPLLDYY